MEITSFGLCLSQFYADLLAFKFSECHHFRYPCCARPDANLSLKMFRKISRLSLQRDYL